MGKTITYQLTREAEEDIISLYLRGANQFGWRQADDYHDRLTRCFEFLADNPLAAPESHDIDPPVRIHPMGAHIIIYKSLEPIGVLILRVRHGREAWF